MIGEKGPVGLQAYSNLQSVQSFIPVIEVEVGNGQLVGGCHRDFFGMGPLNPIYGVYDDIPFNVIRTGFDKGLVDDKPRVAVIAAERLVAHGSPAQRAPAGRAVADFLLGTGNL